MILELDLAFDVAFDRQILAPVQLTLDDNRFSDVHHVPLDPPALRLWYRRSADRLMRRSGRRGRRLAALYPFVTLPHVDVLRAWLPERLIARGRDRKSVV